MTLLTGLSASRNPLAAAAAAVEVIPGDYRIGGVLLSVATFLGGVTQVTTRTKHRCCLGCVDVALDIGHPIAVLLRQHIGMAWLANHELFRWGGGCIPRPRVPPVDAVRRARHPRRVPGVSGITPTHSTRH